MAWSGELFMHYFGCIIQHYNMVGVAVAMVIPIMRANSCIDLHNAYIEKYAKI